MKHPIRMMLERKTYWLLTSNTDKTLDIEAFQMATMLQRRGVIVIGHCNVLLISATIYYLTQATWPLLWLCTEVLLLVVRLAAYRAADHARSCGSPVDYVPLVASGFIWASLLGIGSATTMVHGVSIASVVAGINVAGIIGGVSSRNAATPRYAIGLILCMGAPFSIAPFLSSEPLGFFISIQMLFLLAAIIAVTVQNYSVVLSMFRAEHLNRKMAETDSLSGLYNRHFLRQTLQQLVDSLKNGSSSQQISFSVLCIDLDGFKIVNDTYGHSVGDSLLQAVAVRIRNCLGKNDNAFRIGGDEFVIILTNADTEKTAKTASSVIQALMLPFPVEGAGLIGVGASIGSLIVNRPGYDEKTILRHADDALYAAKRSGKGRHINYCDILAVDDEAGSTPPKAESVPHGPSDVHALVKTVSS